MIDDDTRDDNFIPDDPGGFSRSGVCPNCLQTLPADENGDLIRHARRIAGAYPPRYEPCRRPIAERVRGDE